MSNAKRGLGRGLEALISSSTGVTTSLPSPLMSGRSIIQLDITKIAPNPRQPRKSFDGAKLEELTASIKEQGITSPILTRKKGEMFELIAGERRLRAAKKAGLNFVPAIVKDFSDEQSLEIAIVENLQREDLNPIEEALAYKSLNEEFKLTHEQIAKKVGRDRSSVSNTVRLLDLPKEIVESLSSGQISPGQARPLLGIESRAQQLAVWREIINKNLSSRDAEALVYVSKEKKPNKKSARKKKKDPALKDIEERLMERLGTKVELNGSSQKGRIIINYYSQEDLERILEEIG